MKQHHCVILGVDQAYKSGWAIFIWGTYANSGTANNHTQRRLAIELAQEAAQKAQLPLVVILEGHDDIPASWGHNAATLIGLGAARGRWQECCEMLGVPSRKVVEVSVRDWRRRVFGKQKRMKRSGAKEMAITAARTLYGVECLDDQAEAICLASTGAHHPAVGAVVGKRFRGVDWEPAVARYARGSHG